MKRGYTIPVLIIANLLIAIANVFFIIPNGIFGGGLTGISMVLNKIVSLGIGMWMNIISLILIMLSIKTLDRKIAVQTLLSGVIFAVIFNLLLPYERKIVDSMLIASLVAGVLFGVGVTMCLRIESSSVSVDTIALLINKKLPKYNFNHVMQIVSIILILLGLFYIGFVPVLFGILYTIVYNWVYTVLSRNGGKSGVKDIA